MHNIINLLTIHQFW